MAVGVGDSKEVADATFEESFRDRIASSPVDHHTAGFENLNDIVNEVVAGVLRSKHVFRRGNLADDLSALSSGDGLPLDDDPLTESDETAGSDDTDQHHAVGRDSMWIPPPRGTN